MKTNNDQEDAPQEFSKCICILDMGDCNCVKE